MAGTEAINAAMLEEPTDNGFNADIFRKSWNARPQTADAANDEIDRDPRSRRVIKRIDDSWVDQRIHLHPDRRRPASLGMRNLLRDMIKNALTKVDRRNRHTLKFGGLGVTSNVIEYARNVATVDGIGGKKR